jgi:hypothetical protein
MQIKGLPAIHGHLVSKFRHLTLLFVFVILVVHTSKASNTGVKPPAESSTTLCSLSIAVLYPSHHIERPSFQSMQYVGTNLYGYWSLTCKGQWNRATWPQWHQMESNSSISPLIWPFHWESWFIRPVNNDQPVGNPSVRTASISNIKLPNYQLAGVEKHIGASAWPTTTLRIESRGR